MASDPTRASLSEVFSHPPGQDLRTCPALTPLPAQWQIIADAIATARRWGLKIPAHVKFFYVSSRGREGMQSGQTTGYADGGIDVHLEVDRAMPAELYRTTLHECQHVDDLVTGTWHSLSRADREWRAIDFTARVMGWR